MSHWRTNSLDNWRWGSPLANFKIIETTALGAAYLAGLAVGYWSDIHEIRQHWHKEKEFIPSGEQQKMEELKEGWRDAVDRVLER